MRLLLVFVVLISLSLNSQNTDEIISENAINDSKSNLFDKTGTFTLGFFQPSLIENSNIAKGSTGNLSFKVGGQLFFYKRFFIGGFFNSTYLDNTDIDFTGNYKRSNATSVYLQIGYEASISSKMSLGVSIAPLGYVNYRNFVRSDRLEQQRDSARIFMYEAYFSYDISHMLSIFIDYSYRTDRTNINTAQEIQGDFSKIQYHNFGIGLKLTISSGNFFSNL